MLHEISCFGNKRDVYKVSLDIIHCRSNNSLICSQDNFYSSVHTRSKGEEIEVFNVLFEPFVLRKNNRYVV